MNRLLDTVVLSELRKTRRDPAATAWLSSQKPETLFISAISIGEIARGAAKAERRDPAFASELWAWLQDLMTLHADRIVAFDAEAARIWGRLTHELGHDGADLQIAATALSRGFEVATRNIRHFEPTGVRLVNPWAGA